MTTRVRVVLVAVALSAGVGQAGKPAPKKSPVVEALTKPGTADAGPQVAEAPGAKPVPTDAQCNLMPAPKLPLAFMPGETLEYDVDALGAKAAKMVMKTLGPKNGLLPIEVKVETNTFFSKVRRVRGTGTSSVSPKTLKPSRYYEDAVENEVHRVADVTFMSKEKKVHLASNIDGATAEADFTPAGDALDVAGAIYYLRQLPMKEGLSVCFDAYGIRRLWRVWGKVVGKEHVSLPVGEFEAWHIQGEAARLDYTAMRREIHVWISDDAKRLPLAALGAIDLGAVRATLIGITRPGEKPQVAESRADMKW